MSFSSKTKKAEESWPGITSALTGCAQSMKLFPEKYVRRLSFLYATPKGPERIIESYAGLKCDENRVSNNLHDESVFTAIHGSLAITCCIALDGCPAIGVIRESEVGVT